MLRNMTMQRHLKLYKLPDTTKTPGIRVFKTTDVEAVTVLLNTYLEKFDLTPIFTPADVLHWFIPQKDIIESYVVEDPGSPGRLTDFVSFYTLPSTVMNHPQHTSIKVSQHSTVVIGCVNLVPPGCILILQCVHGNSLAGSHG